MKSIAALAHSSSTSAAASTCAASKPSRYWKSARIQSCSSLRGKASIKRVCASSVVGMSVKPAKRSFTPHKRAQKRYSLATSVLSALSVGRQQHTQPRSSPQLSEGGCNALTPSAPSRTRFSNAPVSSSCRVRDSRNMLSSTSASAVAATGLNSVSSVQSDSSPSSVREMRNCTESAEVMSFATQLSNERRAWTSTMRQASTRAATRSIVARYVSLVCKCDG
mmetsp:Transcript_45213/g.105600  ORF Transcript_45213/g.105600 Transcript_45213/m.105600 type:complete len:222 (-) Transcript_45213:712-1377(-)